MCYIITYYYIICDLYHVYIYMHIFYNLIIFVCNEVFLGSSKHFYTVLVRVPITD